MCVCGCVATRDITVHVVRDVDVLEESRTVFGGQTSCTLEGGRAIDYRPAGGLDYHNSPLMAEIPAGDYGHVHRSIDQLRSMNALNERGQSLSVTDLRPLEYKPYAERPDERDGSGITRNGDRDDPGAGKQSYSAPSTPPTPLSVADAQLQDSKVLHVYVI